MWQVQLPFTLFFFLSYTFLLVLFIYLFYRVCFFSYIVPSKMYLRDVKMPFTFHRTR